MCSKVFAVGLLALGLAAGCDNILDTDEDEFFAAVLTGAGEVPPVTTIAVGDADFVHDMDDDELDYELTVDDITAVTAAHIHLGVAGENGPVVVTLFETSTPLTVVTPTMIAFGEIMEDDVVAVTGFDGTFESLIEEIRAGNAYVNVHTVANPAGEIRGQIVEAI